MNLSVIIVTWNSEQYIRQCLSALSSELAALGGSGVTSHIYLVDNNSSDGSLAAVRALSLSAITVIPLTANIGFAGGNNHGISLALRSGAETILLLNPDVRLAPNALSILRAALLDTPEVGVVTPKLLRADDALLPSRPPRLDSTGMYLTPNFRHLDRGSNEIDTAQYQRRAFVFGATGACMMFSREFALDVAEGGAPLLGENDIELFDSDFFAYREDAELALRAQTLGWRTLYVPEAEAYHRRSVLPEERSAVSPFVNRISVRNRFLLQWKHLYPISQCYNLPRILLRNLIVIAGCVLREHTSLAGIFEALQLFPASARKRRALSRRRRISPVTLARWFSAKPVTSPAPTPKELYPVIDSLLVVIVNYNSAHRLAECVASVEQTLGEIGGALRSQVVISDSASTDDSLARLSPPSSEIDRVVLTSEKNIGFGRSINQAVRLHGMGFRAVLILNPDVRTNAHSLRLLLRDLARFDGLGAVAPLLENEAGDQWGFSPRRLPILSSFISELLLFNRLFPRNSWNSDLRMLNERETLHRETLRFVEQPAAAAFLVDLPVFLELGGFDERFTPAWFEDVDLCARLRDSGYAVALDLGARFFHEGGYSATGLPQPRFMQLYYSNMERYCRKHLPAHEYIVFRFALFLGLFLRATFWYCKSSHDRNHLMGLGKFETYVGLLKLACTTKRKIPSEPV